jgi:hypothetical protein
LNLSSISGVAENVIRWSFEALVTGRRRDLRVIEFESSARARIDKFVKRRGGRLLSTPKRTFH